MRVVTGLDSDGSSGGLEDVGGREGGESVVFE